MAQLVVMYKTPTDLAAFDEHYFGKHVAIAKRIPGLKDYNVSQGPIATPAGWPISATRCGCSCLCGGVL